MNLELKSFNTELSNIKTRLKQIKEITDENYQIAKSTVTDANKFLKTVDEERKNFTRELDAKKKVAISIQTEFVADVPDEKERVKFALTKYDIEQQRIAAEKQREIELEKQRQIAETELQTEIDGLLQETLKANVNSIKERVAQTQSLDDLDQLKSKVKGFKPSVKKKCDGLLQTAIEKNLSINLNAEVIQKELDYFYADWIASHFDKVISAQAETIKSLQQLSAAKADETRARLEKQRKEQAEREKAAAEERKQRQIEQARLNAELEAQARQQQVETPVKKIKMQAVVNDADALVDLLKAGLKMGIGLDKGLREKLQAFANKVANEDNPPEVAGVKYIPKV